MKKILFILLVACNLSFAQNSGITYQAVLYNPNGEELPGFDNPYAALVNKDVCLQFSILDSSNAVEYQEQVQITTDAFGMVNVIIGNSTQIGGYALGFNNIQWNGFAKSLKVDLDISRSCNVFEEISNQPFTYVPFAYYASNISEPEPGPAGPQGESGMSSYEIWLDSGNTGTEEEFLISLIGQSGESGLSAYEIWLQEGNTGTEEEFLMSLIGQSGDKGLNTLQVTTIELAGTNCANGGVKIEVGLDINDDGLLQDTEINSSQTQYICNGTDSSFQNGSNLGDMLYWDGTSWIILPIGTNGQNLTICNGIPTWGPCVSAAIISAINSCSIASTGILTIGASANGVSQTINLTVETIGSYNISATANGITFLGTGTFTTTGSQNVILTATGTPIAAGTNSYTLNTTPSCSFDLTTIDNSTVIDIDGNTYQTVDICGKIWLQSNLNVSRYRNGDIIPQVTDPTEWGSLTTGAWCYYDNDSANGEVYGKLYNWYAVTDPRGLAPEGWHVPTKSESVSLAVCAGGTTSFYTGNNPGALINYLDAGGNIKEVGTEHFISPNYGATNSTNFTALPSGFRNGIGDYMGITTTFQFWTKTADTSWPPNTTNTNLLYWSVLTGNYTVNLTISPYGEKANGYAVRCIRD